MQRKPRNKPFSTWIAAILIGITTCIGDRTGPWISSTVFAMHQVYPYPVKGNVGWIGRSPLLLGLGANDAEQHDHHTFIHGLQIQRYQVGVEHVRGGGPKSGAPVSTKSCTFTCTHTRAHTHTQSEHIYFVACVNCVVKIT